MTESEAIERAVATLRNAQRCNEAGTMTPERVEASARIAAVWIKLAGHLASRP